MWGLDPRRCGTHTHKPHGEWDKTAEGMMLNFAESGHPVFRATSALERGELTSKEKGKKSSHFNGSEENVELILPTYFCQAAQYLRSSRRFVQQIGESLPVQENLPNLPLQEIKLKVRFSNL